MQTKCVWILNQTFSFEASLRCREKSNWNLNQAYLAIYTLQNVPTMPILQSNMPITYKRALEISEEYIPHNTSLNSHKRSQLNIKYANCIQKSTWIPHKVYFTATYRKCAKLTNCTIKYPNCTQKSNTTLKKKFILRKTSLNAPSQYKSWNEQ